MANNEWIQGGSDEGGYIDPPLSRAEQLIQAHPDITVIREDFGEVSITQKVGHRLRHIFVDVEHEEGSQRHYPTVTLSAWETPRNLSTYEVSQDISRKIRSYGLETIVKVHIEDDEQVTTDVGYDKRRPYPHDFTSGQILYLEGYSHPIPAQELIATARTGLEMLKAHGEATREQRARIGELRTGYHGWSQIVDESRPDMDEYIAGISPLFANAMRLSGFSLNQVGTKAIYALNALNQVTDAMLPSEMPPAPQNRREPRQRRPAGH